MLKVHCNILCNHLSNVAHWKMVEITKLYTRFYFHMDFTIKTVFTESKLLSDKFHKNTFLFCDDFYEIQINCKTELQKKSNKTRKLCNLSSEFISYRLSNDQPHPCCCSINVYYTRKNIFIRLIERLRY